MYRQLQEKVKEHIISRLCEISREWRFEIDMQNDNKPVVVGYGSDDIKIRASIEEFSGLMPRKFNEEIIKMWEIRYGRANRWIGGFIIRQLFSDVFKIYGINVVCIDPIRFKIKGKYTEKGIASQIYANTNWAMQISYYVSPFLDELFNKYIMKEQLVSPLLLLLDPIKYFRQYSVIIKKYVELDRGHTLGIYELLLEYFPEVKRELIEKRWIVRIMFWDFAIDIGEVIFVLLFNLS